MKAKIAVILLLTLSVLALAPATGPIFTGSYAAAEGFDAESSQSAAIYSSVAPEQPTIERGLQEQPVEQPAEK